MKTKEPKIELHVAARTGDDVTDFPVKADHAAREIAAGRFYKRLGKWCELCNYLPVCVKDERRIEETLIQMNCSQ